MANNEDALIARLGDLHQQLEQLENVDYMTAYYKGYSTQGDDLETIKEKIITTNEQIQQIEAFLNDPSSFRGEDSEDSAVTREIEAQMKLKKLQKVFLGIFLGLVIVWIIVLSMMYYNGKSFATFIAVAVATLLPNFINILNISNQIKQKEKEL